MKEFLLNLWSQLRDLITARAEVDTIVLEATNLDTRIRVRATVKKGKISEAVHKAMFDALIAFGKVVEEKNAEAAKAAEAPKVDAVAPK